MGKSNNRFKNAQAKREAGQWFPLPLSLIRSRSFVSLSPHAAKLFIDLTAQWNGNNNGDLCATWSLMKERGWRSKETLNKALGELRERDFIVLTRQGGRHLASLYGLTCLDIDDCGGKLDVRPGATFKGRWRGHEPVEALKKSPEGAPRSLVKPKAVMEIGVDRSGTSGVPNPGQLTRQAGQA